MEKYYKYLIFDNHNWAWEFPKDLKTYGFGFISKIETKEEKDQFDNMEKKRMLIMAIQESIIVNFQSVDDMALFVLENLNWSDNTIYLN